MTSGLLGLVVMLFAAYMFSLEREKLIAWYEKCIPGFVKHKINVFMKNSVGVLVSYCLAQLKIMIVIIAILWIGFFIAGIGHSFIYSVLVGIVDIFPILGTGTVIIPWAIFKLITGDIKNSSYLTDHLCDLSGIETGLAAKDDGRQYGNLSTDNDLFDLRWSEIRRIRRNVISPDPWNVCDQFIPIRSV